MKVRFDKHGFYHPSFGRIGRGKNKGQWYTLPNVFAETEEITVPVMDPTTRPPRKVSEKKIKRFKYLPRTAEVLEDKAFVAIREEAEEKGDEPPKAIPPARASDAEDHLPAGKKTTGKKSTPK